MRTLTGHGTIILAIMYLALLIADHYNPTMDFINNGVTKVLILILCMLSAYNAGLVISRERTRVRRREEKRRAARAASRHRHEAPSINQKPFRGPERLLFNPFVRRSASPRAERALPFRPDP